MQAEAGRRPAMKIVFEQLYFQTNLKILYIVAVFKIDFIRLNILRTKSVIVVGFQPQLDAC